MYISVNNAFSLDRILKSFEVAYRSFVVDEILNRYPTLDDIKRALQDISNSGIVMPIVWRNKLNKYLTDYDWIKTYDALHHIKNSMNNGDPGDDERQQVIFLSTLIDLIYFFKDHFSVLYYGFVVEDFFNQNKI